MKWYYDILLVSIWIIYFDLIFESGQFWVIKTSQKQHNQEFQMESNFSILPILPSTIILQ